QEHMLAWTRGVLAGGTLLAAASHTLALLITARVIQGVAGGIFPLSFGIVRDEFPREKVAGSIGFLSAVLGIGAGAGILAGGLIVEHLGWQWLFRVPLLLVVAAPNGPWGVGPEWPVRVAGRGILPGAARMATGITAVLLGISEATTWGWGSARTIGLIGAGLLLCAAWIVVEIRSDEPLIDMGMMRIRAVWTTNLTAFLLGAGMYASFIIFPQFAQLPTSTGFGFGASVVESGVYLLPSTMGLVVVGFSSGWIASRFGSKPAVIVGCAVTAASFAFFAFQHDHPYDMLVSTALLGVGVGLAFAALGNLIVEAVPAHQTGAAGGMNTVMRTIGGALGGQLSATFIAAHMHDGLPTVTGFTETFVMATCFPIVCTLGATLIPHGRAARTATLAVATD